MLPPSWEDLEARVASPQVVGILLLEVATLPLFTEQTVPHTDHLLLVQEVQWQRAGVLVRDVVLLPRGIVTSGQVVAIELPGIHHTVVNAHVAVFMSPSSGQLGLLIEVHREGGVGHLLHHVEVVLNRVSLWAKSVEQGHTFVVGPLPLVVHVVVVVVQRSVGQLVEVLEKVVLVEQVVGLVEVVQEEG